MTIGASALSISSHSLADVDITMAIKEGDLSTLTQYYANADVKAPLGGSRTPIIIAAAAENRKVVRWLIDRGANINRIMPDGATPLGIAVANNNIKFSKFLLKQGAELNLQTADPQLIQLGIDNAVIAHGIQKATAKTIRWLIKQGAELNRVSGNDNLAGIAMLVSNQEVALEAGKTLAGLLTPFKGGPVDQLPQICLGAMRGLVDVMQGYLDLGGSAETVCLQASLLNLSIAENNHATVELLLNAGAAITGFDKSKGIQAGNDIYRLIEEAIAIRRLRQLALFELVKQGDIKALKKLKPTVAELNSNASIVDFSRADLISTTDLENAGFEQTLLTLIAAENADLKLLRALEKMGADLAQDAYSVSPLSVAVHQNMLTIVEYLTGKGIAASPYLIGTAIKKHHWKMATFLLRNTEGVKWQNLETLLTLEEHMVAAASTSEVAFLQAAAEFGYSFQAWMSAYQSPLIPLIEKGDLKVLKLILESLPENLRYRSFMVEKAIDANRTEVLVLLNQLGMSKDNAPFISGILPMAAEKGRDEIVSFLIGRDASVGAPEFHGTQALVAAIKGKHASTVNLLVKQKLSFWSPENVYRETVLDEIFKNNEISFLNSLLEATENDLAPTEPSYIRWAVRKDSANWMRAVFASAVFRQAISAHRETLAYDVVSAMVDMPAADIRERADIFGPADEFIVGEMLEQLSAQQVTSHFLPTRMTGTQRLALLNYCQGAVASNGRDNCRLLRGVLDKNSLDALVLAINANKHEEIDRWFSVVEVENWPTISTELASNQDFGSVLLSLDQAKVLMKVLKEDEDFDWQFIRGIGEHNAVNVLTELVEHGRLSDADVASILGVAAEQGQEAITLHALDQIFHQRLQSPVDWQPIADRAARANHDALLGKILARRPLNPDLLLVSAVEQSANESVQLLLQEAKPELLELSTYLAESVLQQHYAIDSREVDYKRQIDISRQLLGLGALADQLVQGEPALVSSLSFALQNRMMGFLSMLPDKARQIPVNNSLTNSFFKAASQHDLPWLHQLHRHVIGWRQATLQDAYYLAKGDPALLAFISDLAVAANQTLDPHYQPKSPLSTLVLRKRTPAFSAVGHIMPLLNGTLLVSNSDAAIVRDGQIRRRYAEDQMVIDAPLTVIDEPSGVVYLIDSGLGQQGITAWHYEENRVLWRHTTDLPIQNLWLDAESHQLHTLVAPEYGDGTTRYEVRSTANGEVERSLDVGLIAVELDLDFKAGALGAKPLLVPNTTSLLLFKEQEYPDEGAVVSVIDLAAGNRTAGKLVRQLIVKEDISDATVTGIYLAVESFSNLVSIWDLTSGEQLSQLELKEGSHNIAFFDYPHILITDDQKVLRHYNFEKLAWRSVENPSRENFHAASFDNVTNDLIAAGYETEELYTFGAAEPFQEARGALKASLVSADSYEYVHDVVTNGKNLAVLDSRAGGLEDQSWLWQLDPARPLRQLPNGVPLALSNDNRRLMSIQSGDQVAIVDVHSGQITRRVRAPQYVMFQPRFTRDGREAWLLKDNGTISILNTWSDQVVGHLPLLLPVETSKLQSVERLGSVRIGSDQHETCHQLLPDQNLLALCLADEPLLIFSDVLTGEIRARVVLDQPVQEIFPLVSGGYFVLDSNNTGYWLDKHAIVESKLALPVSEGVKISLDDNQKRIAMVSRDEGLMVFDRNGKIILSLSKEELKTDYNLSLDHADFVQNGGALLLAGPGNAIVLPLESGVQQQELVSVAESIEGFEIDSEQSLLVINVQGQTRHNIVWDLATGAQLQRFEAGDLFIGPARNLFGKASGFSDATRRYDLSAATWHEMPSLPAQSDAQELMPSFSLETRILFHAVIPEGKNENGQLNAIEQVLLKTKDKVLWITKSLAEGSASSLEKSKIMSTVELPALLPYLTNVVFGAHVVVQGNRLALFSNKTIVFVSLENGEVLWRQTIPSHFDEVNFFAGKGLDFINDGAYISFAVRSSEKDIEVTNLIFDVVDGSYEQAFTNIGDIYSFEDKPDWLFVPDVQQSLALKLFSNGNIELVDATSKATLRHLRGHVTQANAAHLLDKGRRLITSSDERTLLWRLDAEVEPIELNVGKIQRAEIASGLIWILTETGKLEIHQTDGSRLAELVSMRDGGWLVVSDDGRYDSNTPGNLDGIGWVVSDAPLEALPIEVFMKQYYEPRLLPRLIGKDQFATVKNLAEINRVQPSVNILSVEGGSSESLSNKVSVTVEVRPGVLASVNMVTSKIGPATQPASNNAVYDLRLLRNGVQVAHFPEDHGVITLDNEGRAIIEFENIALPAMKQDELVEFSAMAFNVSGIKSPTVFKDYAVKHEISYAQRRAFIVNVGINHYSHARWNLEYAVNDATAINHSLKTKLEPVFDEVISVPLLTTAEKWITDADVSSVIEGIAKGSVGQAPLTPNDSIYFTWAGHGFASDDGEFHLITSDVGKSRQVNEAFLRNSVSTADLTKWFEPLDADNIVMVIDACNSAASVEGRDFKPGPMGSRGFGQLAWFKGMQIITASQSDDVALESSAIKHGLLTYSMVVEGLDLAAADRKPADQLISTSEWLGYGQQRVPQLFVALKAGNLEDEVLDKRGLTPPPVEPRKIVPQTPALFDFRKHDREIEMPVGS